MSYARDQNWKRTLEKELDTWCLTTLGLSGEDKVGGRYSDVEPEVGDRYTVPKVGERVIINGLKKRQEFNGAHGEVVGRSLDQGARVTVRVFKCCVPGREQEGSVRMQIRASNLLPIGRSASMPNLSVGSQGGFSSETASVRSCSSRGGSVLGRSLLGASGRSALSGSASYLKLPRLDEGC
mmetsp:Transcript_69984/g.126095  ORF Transcript_69984/g.126095 Transcript_69984/m.126095 type:complete len:181 (-) Transcript_69984:66-608(-)